MEDNATLYMVVDSFGRYKHGQVFARNEGVPEMSYLEAGKPALLRLDDTSKVKPIDTISRREYDLLCQYSSRFVR